MAGLTGLMALNVRSLRVTISFIHCGKLHEKLVILKVYFLGNSITNNLTHECFYFPPTFYNYNN